MAFAEFTKTTRSSEATLLDIVRGTHEVYIPMSIGSQK
jgi:hypothetical protein